MCFLTVLTTKYGHRSEIDGSQFLPTNFLSSWNYPLSLLRQALLNNFRSRLVLEYYGLQWLATRRSDAG